VKSFRSYNDAKRLPARAMEPVVDPAGWSPESLEDVESWSYRITEADAAELINATESIRGAGVAIESVNRENFPLGAFAGILRDVRHELLEGRGIVMLQNFPTERLDTRGQAIAYLGLGSYLGRPMSQNMQGHILGHVKDLGGDYADPTTRGYVTRAELRFHADGCDYVGLLCLKTPKSGGASRVASSVTVYNRMLETRPDLVEVLTQDFYRSRKGDFNPGEEPWYRQPMFSFTEGYFSATGAGSAIDKAQGLPGVPPLTPTQQEAITRYRDVVDECAADIPFRPGDVQFLNNYVTLHSRRAYDDWPEADRKRHLLRLWLADPNGRPIPKQQRDGYEGGGVLPLGVKLNAPLDVDELAAAGGD
jgi:hypothetical protein